MSNKSNRPDKPENAGESKTPPRTARLKGRVLRVMAGMSIALVIMLVLAEGAARLGAYALRRDNALLSGKSAGKLIYCIGDSFTYGLGVDPNRAFPQMLERLLDEASATRRADVNNLGFPGLSSTNGYYAVSKAIEQGDAAVILLMVGWNANDSDFALHAEGAKLPVPLSARIGAFLEHSRVYKLAKQALTLRNRTAILDDVELVPQTSMELYDFKAYQEIAYKNLKKAVKLCRRFEIPLVLLNYPYQDLPKNKYSRNEYYHVLYGRTKVSPGDYIIQNRLPNEIAIHSVIRQVGEEEGVPVIDFNEAFEQAGTRGLFQRDWHHPTTRGHEIMAETIFEALGPELVKIIDDPAPAD